MARTDRSALGCGVLLITPIILWLLVRYLLSAAAVAHIVVGDRPDQAHRLQWYADLEARIDKARAARGESPLH